MPPLKPQSNYTKKPIRRLKLPKIGPPKSKGLFEEYFYVFLGIILVGVSILLRAGGMGAYDAIVVGLWVTGFTWFAWQLRRYLKERSSPAAEKKPAAEAQAPPQLSKGPLPLPPGMKPMIGPQWPLKTEPGRVKPVQWPKPAQTVQAPTQPGDPNKPGFVYERPKLPDRKPKLPNNWAGQQDKKPKR